MVDKMFESPSSFTFDKLSHLKFRDLQKLSSQFHVHKRWAKKQDLIEKLLALKNDRSTQQCKPNESIHQFPKNEWKDASVFFLDTKTSDDNQNKVDRRLTFNIDKSLSSSYVSSTFSRETYVVPQEKISSDKLTFSCESVFENLLKEESGKIDPRATFDIPQTGKNLLTNGNSKSAEASFFETDNCLHQQLNTLIIPKRTKPGTGNYEKDYLFTNIKQKTKIQKVSKLPVKVDLVKSAGTEEKKQILSIPLPTTLPQTNLNVNKINLAHINRGLGLDKKNDKENMSKVLKHKKSKAGSEVFIRKKSKEAQTASCKGNNQTHSQMFNKTFCLVDSKKTTEKLRILNKMHKSPSKQILAKKMPDFSKIHQKQFQQMDSLDEYLKKKEERTRKLFGTPKIYPYSQVLKNKQVFQFQSVDNNSSKLIKTNKRTDNANIVPSKVGARMITSAQKEAIKNRLPIKKSQMDIKDRNRSLIQGVRTNKRFELQMKLRNKKPGADNSI